MGKLESKIAVITGGMQPVNQAIANRFAQEGAQVFVLVDTEGEAISNGIRALQCDITSFEDVTRCFTALQDEFGPVDILVNNPKAKCEKTLLETSAEEWNQVLAFNTHSIFYCLKQIMPQLKERGTGKLINITSPAAGGVAGDAAYVITMAAMMGVHGTMSRETERYGTTVCTLNPSATATAEEVANTAVLAASEEGRFMHGQIISVTHSLV